ncbi:MAG: antitoxin of toxin-antitoxin stability system [Cyanobacteria bacterium P01_A01_bin.17]
MNQVTVQQVQQHLLELLADLSPGEGLQITVGERVVGRLVAEASAVRAQRQPGSAVGTLKILVDDDEHLQDFVSYMP